MTREVLTADRTLYVRSDALYTDAPGRFDTQSAACKTWAQAIALAAALDFGGHTVTIQHGSEGAHTFTAAGSFPTRVGGGRLLVKGQSTPGNTVFDVSGTDTFYLDNTGGPVEFQNLTAKTGSGAIWSIVNGSRCEIGNGVICGPATTHHFWVHDNQSLLYILNATFTIAGGGNCFIFCNMGGAAFFENSTVTITGTPNFAGAFVQVINGGKIQSPVTTPATFTGTGATGIRYNASLNGSIYVNGGGATYFPGNSGGLTATGGQYG